jgi:hypothetical protein
MLQLTALELPAVGQTFWQERRAAIPAADGAEESRF